LYKVEPQVDHQERHRCIPKYEQFTQCHTQNSYSAIRRIHTVPYAECSESIAPHSWSRLAKRLAPAKPPLLLPQPRETIPSSTSHDFIDSQGQRRERRDLFDRIGGRAKLLQELPFSSGSPAETGIQIPSRRPCPSLGTRRILPSGHQ
jgi:hypothetical protein